MSMPTKKLLCEKGDILKISWWNVISTTLAVLGIALAIFFHLANQKEREPAFLSTKGLLIYASHSDLKSSNYKMSQITEDGEKPLVGNVYVQELAFWNKGRLAIESEDVLEPLMFQFPEGYEVIDAFVSESTREKIVNPAVNFDGTKVGFSFDILERDEGFKIQVVFSGEEYKKPSISGDIKGVDKIDSKEELTNDNILYGIAIVLLYAVGFLVLGVVIVLLILLFDLGLRKVAPEKEKIIKKNLEKIGAGVMIGLFGVLILLVAMIKVIQVAEEEAKNSVPEMELISHNKSIKQTQ
ncbi:hypothetical protein [Thalassolituus sp. UBA2009]|uniref:hypothetical protein n=1 Tax=Thalassolituus sp. UBA2009 TaxID=1947658 RepID=UPI000C452865|nr:hypothetical protein [Thalassolituus sp. UBA2009]MAY15631.1 hypothetical protein [Oceanospirillaceae bacterium]